MPDITYRVPEALYAAEPFDGRVDRLERRPADVPRRMSQVLDTLDEHGWRVALTNGMDSGGHRFYALAAVRVHPASSELRMTWHTRATGGRTYRLFSAMYGRRDVTVKEAEAIIRSVAP